MIVRELITKLGFKTDTAKLHSFEENVDGAKTAVLALTAAITAAVTATFLFVESAAKAGDRLDKLRDIIGFTTKDYQLLEGAASLAGIENESFAKSLQLFSRSIGMARQGMSEQIKQFAILGINLSASNGHLKSNKELLLEVADAFKNKLTNNVDRATIAQLLFGRAGMRMINFLERGRKGIKASMDEYNKYAFILDKKAIKASQEFTDRQFLLSAAFKGLKNEIGVGMMPVLKKLINQTLEWIAANRKLITSALLSFFKAMLFVTVKLGKAIEFLFKVAKNLIDIWKHLNSVFGNSMKMLTGLLVILWIAKMRLFKNLLTGGLALARFIVTPVGLITAAIVGLLLVLDDVAVYMSGGKSIIGSLFTKFPKFKKGIENLGTLINDFIIQPLTAIDHLIRSIMGLLDKLFGKDQGIQNAAMRRLSRSFAIPQIVSMITAKTGPHEAAAQISGAAGSNTIAHHRNVNFNTSVALTVPPGTSEMQQSFIKQSAEQLFEPIFKKKLRDALTVFPEVEQ